MDLLYAERADHAVMKWTDLENCLDKLHQTSTRKMNCHLDHLDGIVFLEFS